MSNATCFNEKAESSPPSLFQNGTLVFQAHHVGWIVAGFFTLIATIASFWLVNKHLQWYTNKREQRYIVRLLFMVPIYAIISFASYLFWNHSTPLLLIRDAYESTVLTSFFYLLLNYLSPDPEEQKTIFLKVGLSREADRGARKKGEEPKKWVWPLGFIKWKPEDGLYFLQLQKWGVLQYCVIRPTTTLVAVILNYVGLYCESSWSFGWGYVYITIIVSLSVTIAMYCLIQLYVPIATHLAPRKPLLKLFAVKAVVFLTFWQATGLSLLITFGVVKGTQYMTAQDINIGIGALLETFEMMLFAFLHIRAFTYKPYRPYRPSNGSPPMPTQRIRSLGHAMDFRETFREIWAGWLYIWDRIRGKEPRPDLGARRVAYLEGAFGRTRPLRLAAGKAEVTSGVNNASKQSLKATEVPVIQVEVEESIEVDVGGERQWLGLGDNYGYGLGHARRERSDGLEEQIEKELQRRGYEPETRWRGHNVISMDVGTTRAQGHKRQQSWWRNIYNRLSQSKPDPDEEHLSSRPSKRNGTSMVESRSRQDSREGGADRRPLVEHEYDFDDPPPQSAIRMYHIQHQRGQNSASQGMEDHREGQRNSLHEGDVNALASAPREHRGLRHPRRQQYRNPSPNLAKTTSPCPSSLTPDSPADMLDLHPDSAAFSSPSPPNQSTRLDNLIEHVFPDSTGHGTIEHGHPIGSAQSTLPMSHDVYLPSRTTRGTRLMTTKPLSMDQEFELGIGDDTSGSECKHAIHHTPLGSPTETLSLQPDLPRPAAAWDASFQVTPSRQAYRREFAPHHMPSHTPHLEPPTPTTSSPQRQPPISRYPIAEGGDLVVATSPETHPSIGSDPPFSIFEPSLRGKLSLQNPPMLAPARDSSRLRRSSAHIYHSAAPPRRSRQYSLPVSSSDVSSPQIPPTNRENPKFRARAPRRMSTLLDAIPQATLPVLTSSYNHPSHRTHYLNHEERDSRGVRGDDLTKFQGMAPPLDQIPFTLPP